jgi:hypothetical protein
MMAMVFLNIFSNISILYATSRNLFRSKASEVFQHQFRSCRFGPSARGTCLFVSAFEPEAESRSIPPDDLQPVPCPVTEQEKMATQGVHFHFLCDYDNQSVYLFTKICRSRFDEKLHSRKISEHGSPRPKLQVVPAVSPCKNLAGF